MKKLFFFLLFVFAVGSAKADYPTIPFKAGLWTGTLALNDSIELPFTFDLGFPVLKLVVHNHGEEITAEDFSFTKDSIFWHMPVFDSYFLCKRETDTCFSGVFVNNAASHPYRIPFHAKYTPDKYKFVTKFDSIMLDGKWECHFSPGTADSSNAIGIFSTDNTTGEMRATFLTETGDDRYIGGDYTGNGGFTLSTFDGSHAWVFKLKHNADGSLSGETWYGNYAYEKWIAKRNDHYQLRDPYHLTYVTDSSKIGFTFMDLHGKPVSLSDPQFKGKVVIIQVMGSWCPNCMDETAEMSELYKKYHEQGLEIIALAYERSSDTAVANTNIRRVKKKFNADYTFLNTGMKGAKGASESLPFLNGIMSFPTSIYIGKDGKVKRVYTGYNGPATGDAYVKDKEATEVLIRKLLAEK